ncbi:CsbD family protein [Guyparkeria sp. SCN-R1]|uniref:CsbD family protein n=1 Tax=Guyparkeria sp. SCN-R1 TaxID=2341113 RepID=UPI000F648E28|nr:CsbD family protein [Guyparkeria sp. SCN-R1]RRQ23469.1 CsbD family protein [Guyparkeria sp. SCN-R1]
MDSDRIKGKWKQIKGRIKEEWGDLRDDDLDEAEGHRDYLIGKVQERYGIGKDEARKQVEEFERKL